MTKSKAIKDISDLTLDLHNLNVGTERGLYVLDDSLSEVGAGRSIVADRGGVVLAGNKTLQVAADKGFPVRIVQTDGKELVVVQRTDLDLGGNEGERKLARRLAAYDNRAGQLGLEWDTGEMVEWLTEDEDIFEGLFADWELAAMAGEGEDGSDAWKGMPEFEQEDLGAFRTIHVHFAGQEDVNAFAELVKQKITDETKFIWYPQLEITRHGRIITNES